MMVTAQQAILLTLQNLPPSVDSDQASCGRGFSSWPSLRRSTNAGTPPATEVESSCAREFATPVGGPETCGTANDADVGTPCTARRRSQSDLQDSADCREALSDGDHAAYDSPEEEATYDIGGDDGDRDDDTDMRQTPTQSQAEPAEPADGSNKEAVSKRRSVRDGERNQRLRKALRKSLAGQLHLLRMNETAHQPLHARLMPRCIVSAGKL